VELMVVLIILGVILGIGIPKYAKVQAQAEYDADVARLKGIAKEVEMYAAKKDDYTPKSISYLTTNKIIDNVVLNRKKNGTKSVKNDGKKISEVSGSSTFRFDSDLGCITEASLNNVIKGLIGNPIY
jgi:type II secretory pathway pseudopilin PulG